MKRGDIYFADLSPSIGSETNKKRPVLIVSNDANNKFSTTITIIPITSNVTKVYPFEVFLAAKLSSLKKDSKAQCHQIRTISKMRIASNRVAQLNPAHMQAIDQAIRLHLAI